METIKIFKLIGILFSAIGLVFLTISAILHSTFDLFFFFILLGMMFWVIGIVFLIIAIKSVESENGLKNYGNVTMGKISSILENKNISVNDEHPYKVSVLFTDRRGEDHYATHNEVWNIDGMDLGDEVPVYYQMNRPDRNYVDIDEVITQDDLLRKKDDLSEPGRLRR